MQLIEAVPNISEAANGENLARIVGDLRAVLGSVKLLHADSNKDANRTVLTLAGPPHEVVRVCFMLFQICSQSMDMRFHTGAHPRVGAVDVCPLVPVAHISLEETARFAQALAMRVARELEIPVYLYEENACTPQRKNLAFIRRGEYENLPEKLKTFPPDIGPHQFTEHVARTGASVIGARNFLIAFNVSLNTADVKIAREIAAQLRETNGGLPGVKAIGWYMKGYGCAQVSFNLTDYHKSNLHDAFEACKREAAARGLTVTGSELIGLVPQEALLQAGRFYAPKETDADLLVRIAAKQLLLNNIRPFVPNEKILEKRLLDD